MRRRLRLLTLLGAVLLVAVGGCTAGRSRTSPADPPSSTPPQLGGPTPTRHPAPTGAMDRLEQPVADRLAREIAGQGLTLEHLDCPRWRGVLPRRMTCRGYVDGLVVRVPVLLHAVVRGRTVGFDARLGNGLLATANLEATLRRHGWAHADCGSVPAYPARIGSEIVCHVDRDDEERYVVATVSDTAGGVLIADYGPTSGG